MQVRKLHQLISVCLFGGKVKACLELKSKTTQFHTELNVSSHMQLGLIHFPFALSCSLWFSFCFVQENFFSITFHTWLAFIGKLIFPFVKVNPHALIVWALREVCRLWNRNVSRLSLLFFYGLKKKELLFSKRFLIIFMLWCPEVFPLYIPFSATSEEQSVDACFCWL